MSSHFPLRKLASRLLKNSGRPRRPSRVLTAGGKPRGPMAEPLEVRSLLATFTVVNTFDLGAGSLRQAITDANASPGADTINFNIAPSGVQTIAVDSQLPAIAGGVTIDATTEPGWVGTPVVEL